MKKFSFADVNNLTMNIVMSDLADGNMGKGISSDSTEVGERRNSLLDSCHVPLSRTMMDQTLLGQVAWVHDARMLNEPGDAFITTNRNVLGVCASSFPSVILWDTERQLLSHVHASRKSIEHDILGKTIRSMEDYPGGVKPLLAFITPGIGRCCYRFERKYYDEHLAKFWGEAIPEDDGRIAINLEARIRKVLNDFGITNVMRLGGCSKCLWESYTRANIRHSSMPMYPDGFFAHKLVVVWQQNNL